MKKTILSRLAENHLATYEENKRKSKPSIIWGTVCAVMFTVLLIMMLTSAGFPNGLLLLGTIVMGVVTMYLFVHGIILFRGIETYVPEHELLDEVKRIFLLNKDGINLQLKIYGFEETYEQLVKDYHPIWFPNNDIPFSEMGDGGSSPYPSVELSSATLIPPYWGTLKCLVEIIDDEGEKIKMTIHYDSHKTKKAIEETVCSLRATISMPMKG